MELLAPAGSLEKLATAYRYGADAAYIGVSGFSLRSHAEALDDRSTADLARQLHALKHSDTTGPAGHLAGPARPRRLHAALNIFATDHDLDRLPAVLEHLAALPLDAVILADIGMLDAVSAALPGVELHLSTQANCSNAAAARVYHRLGFSRIVPSRELALDDIRRIREAVPELELEVFVHGALCMAHSGRCFLSDFMTGRQANHGDCAQSCRWRYRVVSAELEEHQRPGEHIRLEQEDGYSALFSSRDLNLFDHIPALLETGIDAVKLEGRMKSALYTALVTRSYRAAIDAALQRGTSGQPDDVGIDLAAHRRELHQLPHRPYTSGFIMQDPEVATPAGDSSARTRRLMAVVGARREHGWELTVKNTLHAGAAVELLPADPDGPTSVELAPELLDYDGRPVQRLVAATGGLMRVPAELDPLLQPGLVLRAP